MISFIISIFKSLPRNFVVNNLRLLNNRKGITFIEILLTMMILGMLAVIVAPSLLNYYRQSQLAHDNALIAATLRDAQSRAISQENGTSWGVYFVNQDVSSTYYYKLFYGSSYALGTVISTTYLSGIVAFGNPSSSSTKEIVFSQLTGLPAAANTTTIQFISNSSVQRGVSINSSGLITTF